LKQEEVGLVRAVHVDSRSCAAGVVTNGTNQIRNLTVAQLRWLLTGRVANWAALGGPNAKVQIYLTKCCGSSHMLLSQVVASASPTDPEIVASPVITEILDIDAAVAAADDVIGALAFLPLLGVTPNTDVRAIAIEGVRPSFESITGGKYPLRMGLVFVVPARQGRVDPGAESLLAWLRTSSAEVALDRAFSK
jgi:ABC-type phosphate transport system substrate-binding protein